MSLSPVLPPSLMFFPLFLSSSPHRKPQRVAEEVVATVEPPPTANRRNSSSNTGKTTVSNSRRRTGRRVLELVVVVGRRVYLRGRESPPPPLFWREKSFDMGHRPLPHLGVAPLGSTSPPLVFSFFFSAAYLVGWPLSLPFRSLLHPSPPPPPPSRFTPFFWLYLPHTHYSSPCPFFHSAALLSVILACTFLSFPFCAPPMALGWWW